MGSKRATKPVLQKQKHTTAFYMCESERGTRWLCSKIHIHFLSRTQQQQASSLCTNNRSCSACVTHMWMCQSLCWRVEHQPWGTAPKPETWPSPHPMTSHLTVHVLTQLLLSVRNSPEGNNRLTHLLYDLFQFLARPLIGVFTTEQNLKKIN